MILETIYSLNNVPIRLTDERWEHIVDAHPYMTQYYEQMLDAVDDPEYILPGTERMFDRSCDSSPEEDFARNVSRIEL